MKRLALAALLPLAACGAMEATRTPQMSPVAYPAPLVPTVQMTGVPRAQPAFSANSLWKSGARAFFKDQRAAHVGDIVTVSIEIDDSAQMRNASDRSRENDVSAGVTSFLGLESSLGRVLPGGFTPESAVGFGGETNSSGQGSINRS